jgi:hypothetical protein
VVKIQGGQLATIEKRYLAPLNPAATITEADRPKVHNLIRKELADILSGNQSYYPDGVQKDSQTLASDLNAFIDSIQKLQGRVDDPSDILGGAVADLNNYAKAFKTVREENEPNDQIEVPRESLPNTSDQNVIFPDLGPLSPINPLVPNQRKPDAFNVMPVRSLSRVSGNNSPAFGFEPSAPAAQFTLPGSSISSGGIANWIAALAGVDPQNPTQAVPSPLDDQLRGFYVDDPLQPWLTQRPR